MYLFIFSNARKKSIIFANFFMPKESKDILLALIREKKPMSFSQQLSLTAKLSVPAILAQFTTVMMQFIDASMVGYLGSKEAASIGLVSTCTWLFGGFCAAASAGFSVQVAHLIGANDFKSARSVLRQSWTFLGNIQCNYGSDRNLDKRGSTRVARRQYGYKARFHIIFSDILGLHTIYDVHIFRFEYAAMQWKYENLQPVECSDVRIGRDFQLLPYLPHQAHILLPVFH
jgi:hypothetical protein